MDIRDGFEPGDIGTIVALHGTHYAQHWGFGTFFEAKVARELSTFAARATAHADTHANGRIWLTTFAGLHAARHLYETTGFTLMSETQGTAWGTCVAEQEFQR